MPAVLGHLLVAVWCLAAWFDPGIDENAPATVSALMGAEFAFLVFWAVLFVLRFTGKSPRWLLLFVPVGIWAGLGIGSVWPFVAFAWHVAAVAWADWHPVDSPDLEDRTVRIEVVDASMRFCLSVATWLVAPLMVLLLQFPELGWTASGVGSRYAWFDDSGQVVSYHLTAAWMTTYFFIRAGLEWLWRTDAWRTTMRRAAAT